MKEVKEPDPSTNTEFLNAFSILDLKNLSWDVSTYTIVPLDGHNADHKDRGKIKNIMWDLRGQYKGQCPGYGFIFDIDEVTVTIPQKWDIPRQENFKGYRVVLDSKFQAQANNSSHRAIVAGILRESIKRHFKDNLSSDQLGYLWQDYDDFCQMPDLTNSNQGIVYSRKFNVSPEFLEFGLWVLQMEVSTSSLDARAFGDYYRNGIVDQLAEMIALKRANRLTRRNTPTAIRVWHSRGSTQAIVLELEDPDGIIRHASLDPADQIAMANQTILCKPFNKTPIQIPLSEVRLIPESKISQEQHGETILAPSERMQWYDKLRNFLEGMDVYGKKVCLAEQPIDIQNFDNLQIALPALHVRATPEGVNYIAAPKDSTRQALQQRIKDRANHIRQYGYIQQRPVNPLLMCPKNHFDNHRAKRLRTDLNWLVEQQGLNFRFNRFELYETVHDIEQAIQQTDYDTLFAVLPEGSRTAYSNSNMHEQIKRKIEFPSQCIQFDNTLPTNWINQPWKMIKEIDWRQARSIQDNYKQCILNLLVKHNWVPFVPADPFFYNVHIGIDVGGKHNTRVMACAGYGFMQPSAGLTFLPKEVNVETQQAEPIHPNYLYNDLLSLFDELYNDLTATGIKPDFNRTLFFKDGELRGQGEHWHESDAFVKLRQELYRRKWIDDDALWTALEISKRASYWRVLYNDNGTIDNPTVGRCIFPFPDKNTAIVCTTGEPYLSHGTASPLLVRIHNIYRQANPKEVLRDLVWEADMCFTKIDTGMKLPWVLHVANEGALQQSKAYIITGITV